jgi:hypothetical protein
MLFQSVTADVIPQGQGHCGAGQLQAAITDVRDDLASALRDLEQAPECCERHITQPYWFICPECNFEWREWLKASTVLFLCHSSRADALIAEGGMYQRPGWD